MKVLVISHNSFSSIFNNGKTLSAIFSEFRPNDLCQLFFTPRGEPDYNRCKDYFLIKDIDALKSILHRKRCGHELGGLASIAVPQDGEGHLKKHRNWFYKKLFRNIIWKLSSWYKGGLQDWLKKEQPDLIFYVGGDSLFSHNIAVSVSKKLGIPLATYFTDDYIITPKINVYQILLRQKYKTTVTNSNILFAIGETMAKEYTDFYGKKFYPIMNVVDISQRPEYSISKDNELSISYFGGLHLGRTDEIVRFADFVFTYIQPKVSRQIKIRVFSYTELNSKAQSEFSKRGIEKYKGLSGQDLIDAMEGTDIFLHIESIEPQYHSLTRMSVSTKIPELMALCKPIIAFGPADVASFNVICRANPSLVIDDVSDKYDELYIRDLVSCLNDPKKLSDIAKDNHFYAQNHFERRVVAAQFRRMLENVVNNIN